MPANRIVELGASVVAHIAAGEVVQRPCNVVKELMENCIDAQANRVTITLKRGGLDGIQVQDDGGGVTKEDMPRLCRRHNTSKLTTIDDLQTICSYGFRGEALASMSQVAHVRVTSRATDAPLANTMTYERGEGVGTCRPSAGNVGTVINIDDLFYNMPTRRKSLRSATDELNLIRCLVSHYALHNPLVGFTLKKWGGSSVELKTDPFSTFDANMRTLYTKEAGEGIVHVQIPADALASVSATVHRFCFVKPSACSSKLARKLTVITFVNNRLVQWSALRRPLELICQPFFPPPAYPFIFVSLSVPAHHIDVNVHPSKETVILLNDQLIVQMLTQALDEALQPMNANRSYASQSITPTSQPRRAVKEEDIPSTSSSQGTRPRLIYDHHLVRTDASQPKIYESWRPPAQNIKESSSQRSNEMRAEGRPTDDSIDGDDVADVMNDSSFTVVDMAAVQVLRKEVCHRASYKLRQFIRHCVYIGCIEDRAILLVQHKTTVYRLLLRPLVHALVYQASLFQITRIPFIDMEASLPVDQLVEVGNRLSDAVVAPSDALLVLTKHSTMLFHLFSIGINDGQVTCLPLPLPGVTPTALPIANFVHSLARIDFEADERPIDRVLKCICTMYDRSCAEGGKEMDSNMGTYVFPAIKRQLLPYKEWMGEECHVIKPLVDLHDLYKVFERC